MKSVLILLEDDDLDLRASAAKIMSRAAGKSRAVDQASAVGLWWSWLGQAVTEEREGWEQWLWDLVIGPEAEADTHDDVLFVDEPPNMFRDPLASAARAAEVLASLPPRESEGSSRALAVAEKMEKINGVEVSPIDAQWAERHVLRRRGVAVRRALGL